MIEFLLKLLGIMSKNRLWDNIKEYEEKKA
jgi:hypothetical protein